MDVSPIAKHFKGGGHAAAAGADIQGSLSEIKTEAIKSNTSIVKSVKSQLK
jgi:nanoRNase/pAp phosphatase (c-di-AMP/oligoRNAs hydrolase)